MLVGCARDPGGSASGTPPYFFTLFPEESLQRVKSVLRSNNISGLNDPLDGLLPNYCEPVSNFPLLAPMAVAQGLVPALLNPL